MSSDDLLAGRYRTLRVIGTGGMARVFLAEDERLGRRVAVKRLHAHSPQDIAARFQREAKIGASLNHPNLVAVYDVDTDGESVLIVMEYVEGATLADQLKEGPLRDARVAAIVSNVAAALDHAHAEGIVHRDVKPANILIRDRDHVAKLADLGIATVASGTQITVSGTVMGTAAYMAPEQIEGRQIGPATDVYALAAVAFEALSGQKARDGDTPIQIAHRVVNDPPPDLRDAWPNADPDVAAVLARGMASAPEDRQQHAGELAEQLRVAVQRASTPPPPVVHRTRKPWLVAAAALVALAVVAAGVFAVTRGDGGDSRTASTITSPTAAKPKQRTTEAQRPKTATTPQPAPAPAGGQETNPKEAVTTTPAGGDGAALNKQGFDLLNSGDVNGAIPILQRAVATYPPSSTALDYGFALFNLGHALRLAGRNSEAIPILKRRLAIPNQRATVERELQAARNGGGGKAKGKAKSKR
ncbi:MAG: protein kinase domain-containing protein [Thermoleophilaceae bacterium]